MSERIYNGAPAGFVFTVCDAAAGEMCRIWPGRPMTAHWGVEDPAAVEGTDEQQRTAFKSAYREREARIKIFASLPVAALDRTQLRARIDQVGQSQSLL